MQKNQAVAPPKQADLHRPQRARIEKPAVEMKEADALGEARNSVADLSLGNVDTTRGDLAETESSLLVHLQLYELLGSKEGMAAAYGNLGVVYQTLGDLTAAEAMYNEALKLDDALGRKEAMAVLYGNLGRVHQTSGDDAQAARMYEKALEVHEALGRTDGMAAASRNLGLVYQTRGDVAKAAAMYKQSIALFAKVRAMPQMQQVHELLDKLPAARGTPTAGT
jgi:tetratricopeptide (TPR) repeat protein